MLVVEFSSEKHEKLKWIKKNLTMDYSLDIIIILSDIVDNFNFIF